MFIGSSYTAGASAHDGLFTSQAAARDDESRLAATLRITGHGVDAQDVPLKRGAALPAQRRAAAVAKAKRVASEIIRAVEARLPGRISKLTVAVEQDQFVIRGVSSSYYVKQVAGHLAMTTLDACLPGRLLNEIEVRSMR